MSEFENATMLKRPDEITKRFINPKNQISKTDAHILAQKNGVVWGVE